MRDPLAALYDQPALGPALQGFAVSPSRAGLPQAASFLLIAALFILSDTSVSGQDEAPDARSPASQSAEFLSEDGVLDTEEAKRQAREVARRLEQQGRAILEASKEAKPLRLSFLPDWVGDLFHDFNPAVAGLILLVSSFFRGWRMSLFVLPAAAMALAGDRLGIPSAGSLSARQTCLVVALGLAGLGILFGRARR